MIPPKRYDLLILGGGLAGLSLARQLLLARPELRIAIFEYRPHPLPEAAHKVGESLVEIGAHYFQTRLGLSAHLQKDQLKKAGLRFFFPAQDNQTIEDRIEFGATFFPKTPSFQLDRGRFENYLRELIVTQGADFLDNAQVTQVELSEKLHTVTVLHQEQTLKFQAPWVVDASGRSGLLKRQLHLQETADHDINTAWFRVQGDIDIDTWSQQKAWQAAVPRRFRHLSTNHLMGKGYWTWIIPLASHCTSIGIVADAKIHDFNLIKHRENALLWLQKHEPQLAKVLQKPEHGLLDFRTLKHFSHGCQQVFSKDRWAITGEAGAFLDPFYSPGSDFIAISNDFISHLILSDFQGEDIRLKSAYFNYQYLELFKIFLLVYQHQYPLMGQAGLMIHKIIWDYALYWGISALLYFHQKYTDLEFMRSISEEMSLVAKMHADTQAFFRTCADDPRAFPVNHFTDTLSVDFLLEWNTDLLTHLEDAPLKQKITANLARLKIIQADLFAKKSLLNQRAPS